MRAFFRSLALFSLLTVSAFGYVLPNINVNGTGGTVWIHLAANEPHLDSLAHLAFSTHGRYTVVPAGTAAAYSVRFTYQSGNTVQVDVTRGLTNEPVLTQVVTGTSARNALLRAADLAVEQTNGLGLHGYFASKIAFVAGTGKRRQIYVGGLFLTDVKQITQDERDAIFPRWSPDGSRIVYTSYLQGFPDIFEINLSSYTRTVLDRYTGINMGARFSPDGSRLAMVLSSTGSPEVWIGSASGRPSLRLTRSEAAKSSPCWSPDGRSIVYAQEPGPRLMTISSYGGVPHQLLPPGWRRYQAEPDWIRTSKGDRLVFTVSEGSYQIAVYDFATGEPKVVSKAPYDGIEPSWLPDGRHVVYTGRNPQTSQLCILDTETGKSTTIGVPARIGLPSYGFTEQASVLR